MKILSGLVVSLLAIVLSATNVFATTSILGGHENNPDFIAYYPSGFHGIVGQEGITHVGEDLVMEDDDTLNFLQWFWGTSSTEGLHGEFSYWQRKRGPVCPNGFIEVKNASEGWGSYLKGSGDYCVQTTQFDANNIPRLPQI